MVEELEGRVVPAWTSLGPSPQLDTTNIQSGGGPVTGRISALAVSGDRLIVGAAGGGIWYSDDALTSATPTWHPSDTDTVLPGGGLDRATGLGAGLVDIGCLAVDPRPGHANIVYAGRPRRPQRGWRRRGGDQARRRGTVTSGVAGAGRRLTRHSEAVRLTRIGYGPVGPHVLAERRG
jgi:hypothetical protein